MFTVRERADFLPRGSASSSTLCAGELWWNWQGSRDLPGPQCPASTHLLFVLTQLSLSRWELCPDSLSHTFPFYFFFSCGTFLILSSRIIYLLWFLFLSVSLWDWKFYKGKDVCLCLLLNSQCLEWHPVHKEIFVEWMNALIPISECLLHPIPSGLEVIGLGFEYWLCHKLPLSLSKSLNLAAL